MQMIPLAHFVSSGSPCRIASRQTAIRVHYARREQQMQRTRLNALIVTGHDHFHHRWRAASGILRDRLEATGRFAVKVSEEFRGATAATLEGYDVVLLNYYGADS